MSRRTQEQLTQTLHSILPSHNGAALPESLVQLATSLLLQSQSKAARLKPEEEPARYCAVCEIACTRLQTRLNLPKIQSRPPCPPRTYKKLYQFLNRVLETPAQAAGETTASPRNIGRIVTPSKPKPRSATATPITASKRTGKSMLTPSKVTIDSEPAEEFATPFGEIGTPSKKRKIDVGTPTPARHANPKLVVTAREETPESEFVDAVETLDPNDGDDLGGSEDELGDESTNATVTEAATGRGLGSLMENQFDWLSQERRAEYKRWEAKILRRVAAMEREQGLVSVRG